MSDSIENVRILVPAETYSNVPGVVSHAGIAERVVERTANEIKREWGTITAQVADMLQTTAAFPKQFELDSVKLKIGFDAKGKMLWVAEGSVDGSIEVTLKRKKSEEG